MKISFTELKILKIIKNLYKNGKLKKYFFVLIMLIYLFLYKPYSDINCNSNCVEYCAYNSILLKLLRVFYSLIGFLTINISYITNTFFTKGMNFENPKFSEKYGRGKNGMFDRIYAFTLFETTGGSYMQFSATNALYWSFPICKEKSDDHFLAIPAKFKEKFKNKIKEGYNIHRFVVHPRNRFGEYFKKIIDWQKPYFLIKEENSDSENIHYKVLLIVRNRLTKEKSLTDIWKVLEKNKVNDNTSAKIILSRKLRNYYLGKCNEPIGKGIGQGRSLFVSVDAYDYFKNINLG